MLAQQRIPVANQHRVVAVRPVGVDGVMRNDREERRGARLGQLAFQPRLLLHALLFGQRKVVAPGLRPPGVGHVAVEREESDEWLVRGKLKAIPARRHRPARTCRACIFQLRIHLALRRILIVVIAQNRVGRAVKQLTRIHIFKLRLPAR